MNFGIFLLGNKVKQQRCSVRQTSDIDGGVKLNDSASWTAR